MGDASGVRREALVVGERLVAEHGGELAELSVVAARDRDLAVRAGQQLVRRDRRMRVAQSTRRRARSSGTQEAWFASAESRLDSRLTSTSWPRPVCARACRAARMPMLASFDVRTSTSATPDLHGRAAVLVGVSRDRHESADGLHEEVVAGKMRTAAAAEAGDRAVDDAGVGLAHAARSRARTDRARPGGSSRRARRHVARARGRAAGPPGSARSRTTDSLPRLALSKYDALFSVHGGPHERVSSPLPGRSTLTTRAPRSASVAVAYGPASTRLKSATRRPSRGSGICPVCG